jgi:putative endonuclease
VIARNYRCRGGEIDLVCRDGASLVFVEVRLRTSRQPSAAPPPASRRPSSGASSSPPTIISPASRWPACRFDAVLLDGENIDWIRNAFDAS